MIGEIVLIIIGAVISFFGMVICSFTKASDKQQYATFGTFSAFSFFLVSFINIYSHDVGQFVLMQRFSFTAGLYVMISFAFTLSYIFNINYSTRTKIIVALVSFVFVGLFATFGNYQPWVKSIERITFDNCDAIQYKVHGTWLYYSANAVALLLFIIWLIIIVIKTASNKDREFRVFRYLLGFALVPLFIWIFSMFRIVPSMVANEIMFMILLLIILYVEIFYSLVKDSKLSRTILIENTEQGVIILDDKKRFLYANPKAAEIFEIIKADNKDAITAFVNINLIGEEKYFNGERDYSIIIENIKIGETMHKGFVIWIK